MRSAPNRRGCNTTIRADDWRQSPAGQILPPHPNPRPPGQPPRTPTRPPPPNTPPATEPSASATAPRTPESAPTSESSALLAGVVEALLHFVSAHGVKWIGSIA